MDYKVQRKAEEINAAIRKLSESIAKSMSSLDKTYHSFSSKIRAMQALSREAGKSEFNSTSDLLSEKIEDIADNLRKASITQLKIFKVRLANMKDMAKENLEGKQLEGINQQIQFMMDRINEETLRRRVTFSRLADFLKRNQIDAISITTALTTRNPIIGLGIKYVLERIKASREADRLAQRSILQDKIDLKRKLERDAMIAARKERLEKERLERIEKRKQAQEEKEKKEKQKREEKVEQERRGRERREEEKRKKTQEAPQYKRQDGTIIDAEWWDIPDTFSSTPGIGAASPSSTTSRTKQSSKLPLLLGPASYDYEAVKRWALSLDSPVSVSALRKAFKLDEPTAIELIRRLKQDGIQVFGKKANKVASDIPWPPPGHFQRASAGPFMPDSARREFMRKFYGIGIPKMLPEAPPGARPRDHRGKFLKVEKVSSEKPEIIIEAKPSGRRPRDSKGRFIKLDPDGSSKALVPYTGGGELVPFSGGQGKTIIDLLKDIKTGIYSVDKTMVRLHEESESESALEEEARLEEVKKEASILPKLLGPGNSDGSKAVVPKGPGFIQNLVTEVVAEKVAHSKIPGVAVIRKIPGAGKISTGLRKIPGLGRILGPGVASVGTAAASTAGTAGVAGTASGLVSQSTSGFGKLLTGPLGMLGGSLIMMAVDGVLGWMKRTKWGVSGGSAFLGGAIGGSMDRGILNTFANAGKWALLGASLGSVVPIIGTLSGGLIGAAIGGIFGMIGGENISHFMEKTGIGRFFTSFFSMVGAVLLKPFKLIWTGIKTLALGLKVIWKTITFITDIVLIPLQKIWDSTVGPILEPFYQQMSTFLGWFSDIFDWVTRLLNSESDFEKTIDQLLSDDKLFEKVLGSFQRAFLEFAASLLEKVPSWVPGSGILHSVAKDFRKKSVEIAKRTESTVQPPPPKDVITGGNTVQAHVRNSPVVDSFGSGVSGTVRGFSSSSGASFVPVSSSGASPVPQPLSTPGEAMMPGSMKTSDYGIEMIKKHEGFAPKEYWDFKGYSIGYGHLQTEEERKKFGGKITEAQATELLKQDVAKTEAFINKHVKVPLTQDQFDALVSFGHSGHAFLKNVISTLNSKPEGDFEGAAARMKLYVKVKRGGQYETLPGLVARREEETGRLLRGRPQQGQVIASLQRDNENKRTEIIARNNAPSQAFVSSSNTQVNNAAFIAPQTNPRNTDSTYRTVTQRNY